MNCPGPFPHLPKLASGTLAGYPRVYEVAIALIGHTEGHVQFENIELFVREFQRGARLTTGELWAVPTMLRLGLMENIRRMALRTVQRLDDVDAADHWAQRLREASDAGAQPLATELATFIDQHPPLKPAFIARFLQQIRTYQTNFTPLVWLEQWIAEDGMSAEEAVARSNQRLALTQVVMANSITSLRTIARLDWSWFVESLSGTEAVLLRDPSDAYPRMTFATRDRYRHVVEDIAKNSPLEEREVAARALELAQRAAVAHPAGATPIVSHDGAASADPRTAHIGYYLVDSGRSLLEAAVGYRPPWRDRLYRWVLRHGDMVYFGGIAAVTLALLAIALLIVGPMSLRREIAVLLVSLIPANEVAISIIHQLITLYIPPRMLAKLDYVPDEDGVPRHPRGRKAVFLGDLVDRGPDTPAVLRLVMEMVKEGTALCVPGNHDIKLMKALNGRDVHLTHGLDVSLENLSLDRVTNTQSGGESQRVKIVKHLNGSLVDVMYIFD